jgi:glutaredoxin 3
MITVYSRDNCVFCARLRHLLESHGIEYEELLVDRDFNRGWLKSQFPRASTFPVVVVDGQYLGGLTEAIQHFGKPINEQQLLVE